MYGWWFQPTPLKNDGVRQLGWWHSQLNGKIKNVPNHQPVLYYLWTSWTITSERLMFLGFSWYVLVLRKPSQLNAPMCTDPTSKSRRLQCVRPPRWALATRGGLETLSGRSQNSLVQLGIDPAMFQHGRHHTSPAWSDEKNLKHMISWSQLLGVKCFGRLQEENSITSLPMSFSHWTPACLTPK